jgi:UrcA family protein
MNRFLATSLALLFASSTVSSACFAGPNGEASAVVRYDDLDLSTPAGVKALRFRLERAADQACGAASGIDAGQQPDWGCMADAMAAAIARVPSAIAEQRLSKARELAKRDPR